MRLNPSAGRRPGPRRGAITLRGLLLLGVPAALLIAAALFFLPGLSHTAADSGPMMHHVEHGEFVHDVTERGELESADNVEIRCEVKSQGSGGTTILEIVPEGTLVQANDILVKLDSSSLENDRTRQQIAVANSEADLIKARTALESAQVALKEYVDGVYKQNVEMADGDVIQAKENVRRAREYVVYSQTLANKGYITDSQLKADVFASDKADKDLTAAQMKRDVLAKYTLERMQKQLEGDIEAAEARLKAQQHSNELELGKLADLESQLDKCVIRAPCAGQVVYVNPTNPYSNSQSGVIEAGVTVRERQEIIRLPDHSQMQVRAKINEAKVSMVAAGMPATVRLDAFPEMELAGTVQRVNEYPVATSRYTSSVKEYETLIRIHSPPPGARPGLTAEVKIHVERLTNALLVPVQAVFEHGTKQYAVVRGDDGFSALEVKLGSTNDKTVVVREGLEEKQEIVLNAAAYRSKVELPELPPEKPAPKAAEVAGAPAARPSPGHAAAPTAAARGLSEERPIKPVRIAMTDPNPGTAIERLFKQFDSDKDGRIELTSLPESLRAQLTPADANRDGEIDRAEMLAIMAKITGRPLEGHARARPAGGASP